MKQMRQRIARSVSVLLAGALLVANMPLQDVRAKAAANTIVLDKSAAHQEIWGFGGASNHVVDDLYSNPLYAGVRDEIMDKLFHTTGDLGAGLSVVRWEINPFLKTETGPQAPSFYYKQATVHPDANTWDWDTDYHQKWFGDEANRRADDMQFIAVPWSPPTWMKDQATNSLKPENYDEFAQYIATWLEKYKTGVPFSASDPTLRQYNFKWVSVQNEPELHTNYGSNYYSAASGDIGKVAIKVKNAVAAKGLDVMVGAPETGSRSVAQGYLQGMSQEALAALDFIPVHDYGPAVDLSSYGKPVWTTEYCYLTSNNPEISDGLNMAQGIFQRLTVSNDPGWLQWWFVSADSTNGEALIQLTANGDYKTNKRLYTMGQFSRFMRPGDIRIDAVSSNPNLQVVATKNANQKASLVVINNWPEDYTATVSGLDNGTASVYRTSETEDIASLGYQTIADGSLSYTFPAKSVTTIVEGTADAPSAVKADPKMGRFSSETVKDPNKFYPVSDTFARNGMYGDTTNGTLSTIDVKAQPGFDNPNFTRKGFLQFDLSSINSPIESVTFNIYGLTDSGQPVPGLALYPVESNDWNEYALTWNNMPGISGAPLGYFSGMNGAKTKFSFDVTDYVNSRMAVDKKISFAIADTLGADQMARFDSKDNEWRVRPTLQVLPSLWPADSSLAASHVTEGSVSLEWSGAQSASGIASYLLYMNGNPVQTLGADTRMYTVDHLVSGVSYTFQVRAKDGTGRVTADGPALTLTAGDDTPPVWGAGASLTVSKLSPSGLTLSWPAAEDTGGIARYAIYRDGQLVKTAAGTATGVDIAGLAPGTAYTFAVKAEDGAGNVSAGLELSVSTPAGGDTASPDWEAGDTLLLSGLATISATLAWPEAKDDTGVAGYRLYNREMYMASTEGTAYELTGLAEDTLYTIRVEAVDEAGNLSSGGPELSFKTLLEADTTPPNWFEAKLSAADFTDDGFTLRWEGAKDRGGVTAYRIFSGTDEIVTLPADASSFAVRGVDPGAPLHYKVEAGDAAGNWSVTGPSLIPSVPDIIPPVWPADRGLRYSDVTDTSVVLNWIPATDNRAVAQYAIYRNGVLSGTAAGNAASYIASGLERSTAYTFQIEAVDAAGNRTGARPEVSVRTLGGATVNPEFKLYPTDDRFYHEGNAAGEINAVDRLKVKHVNGSTTNRQAFLKFDLGSVTESVYKASLHLYNFELEWNASGVNATADLFSAGDDWTEADTLWANRPDMIGLLGSVPVKSAAGTAVPVGWISFNVTDYIDLERRGDGTASFGLDDLTGNNRFMSFYSKESAETDKMPYLSVMTQSVPEDSEAPSWPGGSLAAADVRPDSVSLAWSGASDNVGINGYRILQNGAAAATVAADVYGYQATGLEPGQAYTFKVEAIDGSYWSTDGPSVTVTTAERDMSPPTWPQGASLQSSSVSRFGAVLHWTPAADNWGVVGYRIWSGSMLAGTVGGSVHSYEVTGLAPGATYSFTVTALDRAGNSSAGLQAEAATLPPDAQAPEWPEPAVLEISRVGNNGLLLAWPAAADDEAVTGYAIFVDDQQVMTISPYILSYYVYGLKNNTPYMLGIRAADASGKFSNALAGTAVTKPARDTAAPQWPVKSTLTATSGSNQVVLAWNTAVDNDAVAQYRIYRDGAAIGTAAGAAASYTAGGLEARTTYSFKVEAGDAAGNWSSNGPAVTVTTTPLNVLQDVTISASATRLAEGGSTSLVLTARMLDGAAADLSGAAVSFSSSNDAVARVVNGHIAASRAGTAVIQATVALEGTTVVSNELMMTVVAADTTTGYTGGSASGSSASPVLAIKDSIISADNLELDKTTGEAKAAISEEAVRQALEKASPGNGGGKTVTVRLAKTEGAAAYTTILPAARLMSVDAQLSIRIETALGSMTLPGNMLRHAIPASAKEVSVTMAVADRSKLSGEAGVLIGERPVVVLKLEADGKSIGYNNPDAPVAVALAYAGSEHDRKDPERVVIVYLDDKGNILPVPTGKYDQAKGEISFITSRFGVFAAAYVTRTFEDIGGFSWAEHAIEVLAAKGVVDGTAPGAFTPAARITRADFVMLLVHALGLTAATEADFADVDKGSYYYEAVGAARKLGLVSGTGDNRFNPEAAISRQDLMVMAARAMKLAGKLDTSAASNPLASAQSLGAFEDLPQIADYAVESVEALVRLGIVQGSGNVISPQDQASRAEAAVIIYRIYNR